MISKRMDCRLTKFMTVLHVGVCHRTSTPHKSGNKMKRKKKMYNDIRLHTVWSYTSFPDIPLSMIYSLTLSNHLHIGLPLHLFPSLLLLSPSIYILMYSYHHMPNLHHRLSSRGASEYLISYIFQLSVSYCVEDTRLYFLGTRFVKGDFQLCNLMGYGYGYGSGFWLCLAVTITLLKPQL